MGFMHIRSRGAEGEMLIPRTKTEDEGRGFHWNSMYVQYKGLLILLFILSRIFKFFFLITNLTVWILVRCRILSGLVVNKWDVIYSE